MEAYVLMVSLRNGLGTIGIRAGERATADAWRVRDLEILRI